MDKSNARFEYNGSKTNPAMVRARPRGFADEVPYAHKEIVPISDVFNGNYSPNASLKYNDIGVPSTGPQDAHIQIR